jgi:hypothetical protein
MFLEPGSRFVAPAHLFNSVHAKCGDSDQDWGHLTVAFPLGAEVIRAIDLAREHGRDEELKAQLRLYLHLAGPRGPSNSQAWLNVALTKSDWSRVVKEMKYGAFATFEAPVAGSTLPECLATASKHFDTALQLLRDGNWKNAVGECRDVLDAIEALGVPQGPPYQDWVNPTARQAWDLKTRIAFGRQAIRHIMHVAHHGPGAVAPEEARFAVFSTGALLTFYSDALK